MNPIKILNRVLHAEILPPTFGRGQATLSPPGHEARIAAETERVERELLALDPAAPERQERSRQATSRGMLRAWERGAYAARCTNGTEMIRGIAVRWWKHAGAWWWACVPRKRGMPPHGPYPTKERALGVAKTELGKARRPSRVRRAAGATATT